jgi:hypothetical protein
MSNCREKISYTCGKKVNARCVDYEGELSSCTELGDCPKHSVHDVLSDINRQLSDICEKLNIEDYDSGCLELEENSLVNILQELTNQVCELKEALAPVDCPPVFSADISCLGLDYQCLADPCGEQPQNLTQLLQLIINQVCNENPEA